MGSSKEWETDVCGSESINKVGIRDVVGLMLRRELMRLPVRDEIEIQL